MRCHTVISENQEERPVPAAEGYTVHSFLGQGSSGTVWRATQEGTLREVALKFPAPWARHGPGGLRFAREAEIGASLEHKNVIRIFGGGSGVDGAWLAMELVEGSRVDVWAAERNPGMRERVDLFRQICAGVLHAHQRGVIHRDLKPGNILVTEDGTPKVADFGLACWEDGPSLDVTLTRQGDVFGSLAWMPPEQAAGRWAEVDALSDIYALGAVLFNLISGRPPLDGALPLPALLAAAQTHDRPRLRAMRRDTPKDLAAIADKCLSLEKHRRYQSSAELHDDVSRWLAGEPVRARPAAPFYWFGKKIRRHWPAASAAAAVACAALGMAWTHYEGRMDLADRKREALSREAAQTAKTLQEAQELVTRLLMEMPPKPDRAANRQWAEEAEKMVAAFPWSINGGAGAYDPRPFRARTAMSMAEDQMERRQWGSALRRWQEASQHLRALVADHPETPAYRTDSGMAKLGEGETLLHLGYHNEAITAARQALAALTPPSGFPPPEDATLKALVDAASRLAGAVLAAGGRTEETLEIVTGVSRLIVYGKQSPDASADHYGWLARLDCDQVSLTARLKGAPGAAAFAAAAVANARKYYEMSGTGELAAGVLAESLAVGADVARDLGDVKGAGERLMEAHLILTRKKSKSERTTVSIQSFKRLAAAWDRHAVWKEKHGLLSEAVFANGRALKLYSAINRMNTRDPVPTSISARLFLRNARLWNQLGQSGDSIRCAVAASSRFRMFVERRRPQDVEIYFDQADAALLLAELEAPPPEGGQTWAETARSALLGPQKKSALLKPDFKIRLESLEQRLRSLP